MNKISVLEREIELEKERVRQTELAEFDQYVQDSWDNFGRITTEKVSKQYGISKKKAAGMLKSIGFKCVLVDRQRMYYRAHKQI